MRIPSTHLLAATLLLCLSLLTPLCPAAEDPAWSALDAANKDLRPQESDLRLCNAALAQAQRATAPHSDQVAPARKALEEAEKALATAGADPALAAARDKMDQARAARDQKVESLLTDAPAYQAALARRAELQKQIAALEARLDTLKDTELLDLARLQQEEGHLAKQIYAAQRAWWKRGEVEPLYKVADEAYKAEAALTAKSAPWRQANDKLKAAQKALADAIAALPLDAAPAKALLAKRAALEASIAQTKAKIAELEKGLIGGATTVTITAKAYDRKTRQEIDKDLSLWLPPNQPYIRGVIIAHPMIKSLATSQLMRLTAAREGLATMVYDNFASDGKESLARLDALFEKFAAKSGHPELKGAPVLLGGLSASVLGTRNVACAVPSRVFGIVHAAGGNMQEMPDDGRGMVQVPFIAHNGEFEWASPIGGLRPEYGNQTQWLMIREQMLRLWRNRYEHRMMLIVVPGGDHGAWDANLTALFIRKAAQYRLPKDKRDGSTPAVCTPLPASSGWLTDADLDHPKFDPAPYESYKGDKNNAFWCFDEEMARAVYAYHQDKFLLPDPTKTHPVPADWPPAKKRVHLPIPGSISSVERPTAVLYLGVCEDNQAQETAIGQRQPYRSIGRVGRVWLGNGGPTQGW